MVSDFDPGALLGRSYSLTRGPRVRLRLARSSDSREIVRLLERQGVDPDDFELARLLRCNPLHRVVFCATALVGTRETIVGIGAIDVRPGAEPDVLIVDEQLTDGLRELLASALTGRANAIARGRAA